MKLSEESVMEFPCEFPIKAMGRAADDFDALVVSIVRRYAPGLTDTTVKTRPSRGGQYLAVTVTITAESRDQLDNIYRALTAEERILMAL